MCSEKEILVEVDTEEGKDGGDGFEAWWEERSLPEKVGLGILFAMGGIALMALFGGFVMLQLGRVPKVEVHKVKKVSIEPVHPHDKILIDE